MVRVRALTRRATHFGYLYPGDVVDIPPAYAERYAEEGAVEVIGEQPKRDDETQRGKGKGKPKPRRVEKADA